MLSDASTYLLNVALNHLLRGQVYTPPAQLYVGALKRDLTEVGTAVSGSPAAGQYNRAPATFTPATARLITNMAELSIQMPTTLPAGTPVPYVAAYDAAAAGNLLWLCPGTLATFGATATAATDLLDTGEAHGLAAGDLIIVDPAGASSLPTGLAQWSTGAFPYHVIAGGLSARSFKVSTVAGGAALDIASDGSCIVRKIGNYTLGASQNLQIQAGDLVLQFG